MFIEFFYLLRKRGLKVSLNEWMALMEALNQGLAQSSLTSFYYLCRAVLIKSETEYDKFDLAFAEFFKGVEHQEDIPEEVWDWLENEYQIPAHALEKAMQNLQAHDFEELQKMLEERLKEQKEEHHGGGYWIGTGAHRLSDTEAIILRGYGSAGKVFTVRRCRWRESVISRISGRTISSISGVFRWRSASFVSFPPKTTVRRRN